MNKKPLVCMLAALVCSVPFAACATPAAENENDLPVAEETLPPVQEPIEPTAPALPEEPEVPEVNEPDIPVVAEPEPGAGDYVKILSGGLNIRSGAGTNYASLGTVEKDILMKYAKKSGDWYETYYRGKVAYVSANPKYTAVAVLDTASEKIERVIEEGLRYVGTPYVYGAVRYHDGKGNKLKGFTKEKFDCSSYMQYIFLKGADVLLNTTTRTQISQGKEIKKADIQRGDLLFFTNASRKNNTGIERVGHVALYLGDNYILHTASDYAKVEQITSLRWSYFITAKRVV